MEKGLMERDAVEVEIDVDGIAKLLESQQGEKRPSRDELTKQIRAFALKAGADRVGFALYESMDEAPEGRHPRDILPTGKSMVVIVKRYLEATVDSAPSFYSALQYTQLNTYIERMAFDISCFIEDQGYRAMPVPATQYGMRVTSYMDFVGVMSQRHAAIAAGLGTWGLNDLLITPDFGPRVRIITILTDAELTPSPKLDRDPCIGCNLCVKYCPAHAISADRSVGIDKGKCMLCLMETKRKTGGEGTCGICQKVCPVARDSAHLREVLANHVSLV